ncbi:outer membrane protein assembly factor BamD [Pseudidiomarina taiwanensis]|uniref:Outer membrane protein assembly factor BamD n=1 Tax=Pseudidiomarina taiwanensis TaxID=337250 RepID=A0A432ZCP0_9GAMM|nr:outer membrane protein assembly factor BamD [Pseudidiomarina taiwanensis]RUO75733.1 outer membrane protein assembly factor BamD [Pseudidiomarina taiwanensis]
MKLRLIFATIALVSLLACSGGADEAARQARSSTAADAYERAQGNIAAGNYQSAAEALQQLSTRFPFGPYAHQVQLDLIFVYYKLNDIDKALAGIDRFMRLNPNHQDVDYAMYMRGLVNQRADYNLFHDLLDINRSDRDPSKAREAFNDFARLLRMYPDSKYAADAKQRMVALKSRLAQHELAVARYYVTREAYLAAANRSKYVVEHFANTPEVEEALAIMMSSYAELDLTELSEEARQMLAHNFPSSGYLN